MMVTKRLRVKVQVQAQGFTFVRLSPRVGYFFHPQNPHGWAGGYVAYLGYSTKKQAEGALEWATRSGYTGEVRKGKRLDGQKWELKVQGLPQQTLLTLAQRDLGVVEAVTAAPPRPEKPNNTPKPRTCGTCLWGRGLTDSRTVCTYSGDVKRNHWTATASCPDE
jgi:hypothetical protein